MNDGFKNAVLFIQHARNNEEIKAAISAHGANVSLVNLTAIAQHYGFKIEAECLREAFVKEWALRRNLYSNK